VAAVATQAPRSLLGKVLTAWQARAARNRSQGRTAAVVREHLLTVVSFAAIDVGAFHAGALYGWIAAGVLGIVFDFQLRG